MSFNNGSMHNRIRALELDFARSQAPGPRNGGRQACSTDCFAMQRNVADLHDQVQQMQSQIKVNSDGLTQHGTQLADFQSVLQSHTAQLKAVTDRRPTISTRSYADLRGQLTTAEERIQQLQSLLMEQERQMESSLIDIDYSPDDEIMRKFSMIFSSAQQWASRIMGELQGACKGLKTEALAEYKRLMPLIHDPRDHPAGEQVYVLNVFVHFIGAAVMQLGGAKSIYAQGVDAPEYLLTALIQKPDDRVPFKIFRTWNNSSRDILTKLQPKYFEDSRSVFVHSFTEFIAGEVIKYTGCVVGQQRRTELGKIFEDAFEFCRILDLHPAGYELSFMPGTEIDSILNMDFDARFCDDLGATPVKPGALRLLCGSVFPALAKVRDEDGKKIPAAMMCKAKVLTYQKTSVATTEAPKVTTAEGSRKSTRIKNEVCDLS